LRGGGADLSIVKRYNPNVELFGVDFGNWNSEKLKELGINLKRLNIELDQLPFDNNSIALIIGSEFCEIVGFWGAQFYPFPSSIARILSKFFPSSGFSIFFLMKKTKEYKSQFIQYPKKASLETNFFIGHNKNDS
jgi:hypothetical protein